MSSRFLFACCCLILIPAALAGNLTRENQQRTDAVIAALVEAYGGAERLAGLQTLTVEHSNEFTAIGQSRTPAPPWDTSTSAGTSAIDIGARRLAFVNRGRGNGFEFHNGTLIGDDASFQLDYRAGVARPLESPDFDGTAGPLIRVTPALLVRELQAHARTAHWLGTAAINGREHDVVRFAMASGPAISLYIDRQRGLITHSERIVPGFGLIEYDFTDYESVDGIPFNRTFALHQDGELSMRRKNASIAVNAPIAPLLAVDDSLAVVAALPPDPLSRQELADGVFLIGGGGTYGLFIEMADHVIAVGGVGGLDARLASLREVTDKPVRYGVLTHHHNDHVLAVPGYAEAGATIVAPAAHAGVVNDTAGARAVALLEVDGRADLSDTSREVVVIDIGPTPHTEHLLVTWLPEEKILFEADHFAMPRSGPVPPAVDNTRAFAAALRRLELEPAWLVSAHSPRPATMRDLASALDTPVAKPPMVGKLRGGMF